MEKYKGTLTFDDSITYEGDIIDGKPDGEGVLTKENVWTYEGEFKNGKRNGKGTLKKIEYGFCNGKLQYSYGDIYEGEWKNDKREGFGTLTYNGFVTYVGEWKNDVPHGQGRYNCTKEYYYEGEWKEGKKDGNGVEKWGYGIYKGTFKNENRHGVGRCEFIDGSVYEGEWSDSHIDGHGKLYGDNGNVFIGEWNNDYKNKTGEIILASGEKVKGKWDDSDFIFDSKFKTGLKLYIYYNKELTGIPDVFNLDECKSNAWLKDKGSSSSVIKFLYTYFGSFGFGAKFYFDEGYSSRGYGYPTSISMKDTYIYSYTEVEITGPTDWEEGASKDYKWLVLRKE